MPKYTIAPEEIVELVEEIRAEWHPDLEFARIGILMRAEAPRSKGSVTFAAAKRAPEDLATFGIHYHFIIWFAEDTWETLTAEQQRALVDHELSHCSLRGGVATMVTHDFADFNAVIARHGLWWPSAEKTIEAFQPHFEFLQREGGVDAIDPAAFNERDVMEQVDDVLDGEGDDA